jgi:hypothetical protein
MQLRTLLWGSPSEAGRSSSRPQSSVSGNSPQKQCKGAGQKMFSVDYPSRLDNLSHTL